MIYRNETIGFSFKERANFRQICEIPWDFSEHLFKEERKYVRFYKTFPIIIQLNYF